VILVELVVILSYFISVSVWMFQFAATVMSVPQIVPCSEDPMDLGPFLQNYVLKNPFGSLMSAGNRVRDKPPRVSQTDFSCKGTKGTTRGRHKYATSIRNLLSGSTAGVTGDDITSNVEATGNCKIKTSPSDTQVCLWSILLNNFLSLVFSIVQFVMLCQEFNHQGVATCDHPPPPPLLFLLLY